MRRGKNSFNALAKLGKKLTPEQRKQLGANMGNIFGVNPQGLGSINAMQEAYGAQNPMQQGQSAAAVQQMLQQMGIGQGPGGIQPPGVNPPPPPPGGPGINPPGTGDPPAWGDPSGPGPAPQPPDRDAVGMPIGGGAATGAAGQTPIRVSDPGTFFGGQQGGIGNLQGAMGIFSDTVSDGCRSAACSTNDRGFTGCTRRWRRYRRRGHGNRSWRIANWRRKFANWRRESCTRCHWCIQC